MKKFFVFSIFISFSILIAKSINLPLPWLMGPLLSSMVLSFNNFNYKPHIQLWNLTRIIIGIYLGSRIDSNFFINLTRWSGSFLILVLLIITSIICVSFIYRKYGKFDLATSISSSTPGGMSNIFLALEEMGEKIDPKKHFVTHLTRIFLVISFIPFFIRYFVSDLNPPHGESLFFKFDIIEIIKLLSISIVFSFFSSKLKLPAPVFLGSIIGTGILYGFELTNYILPDLGLNICLAVIGFSVGSRFSDYQFKDFLNNIKFGLFSFLILMLLTILFSYISSILFDLDFLSLVMSYAPGGIYEMTGIAISFDYEVDFILAHHLARLFLIILIIPFVCKIALKL